MAATPLRNALSHVVGWLADRKVPRPLRAPLYRSYCRLTGADAEEARPPLEAYPTLGAFFVRRLRDGLRPFPDDPALLGSPVDGRVQAVDRVGDGRLLQAKGRPYALRELLAGVGAELDLEGGTAFTIYLSPRDYHRIHTPLEAELTEVAWVPGARHSVSPRVLERRSGVLAGNERAVLRLETAHGPALLVLVGALNVGRIRVVGVPPGRSGPLSPSLRVGRGEELGRFEMGSTIVLIWPAGAVAPVEGLESGTPLRLGQPLARLAPAAGAG